MEFSIRKSARSCGQCATEFAHGQSIHSAVSFSEEDALVRADYCDTCWTPQISRAAYSAWTTHFLDPKVADQQPPELFSPLRRLFYEACASEDRLEQAKAFLAAQLLRRQKVFRQIKESSELDGETRTTLYTDRIGNQFIEVRDPNFTYAELDEARALLLRSLREIEEGGTSDAAPVQGDPDGGDVTADTPVQSNLEASDATSDAPESVSSGMGAPERVPESDPSLSDAG
jgi:hypothetical protein